jgi:hypothetical protein
MAQLALSALIHFGFIGAIPLGHCFFFFFTFGITRLFKDTTTLLVLCLFSGFGLE